MGSQSGVMGSVKVQVVWDSSVSLVWGVLAQTSPFSFSQKSTIKMILKDFTTLLFLLFPLNVTSQPLSERRDPNITKFHVTSKIQLRYASTEVLSHIRNPSLEPQEVTFEIRLPEKAFIHGFSMTVSLDRIILRGDQMLDCRWTGKSMWQQLKPRPRQERPTSLRGRSV